MSSPGMPSPGTLLAGKYRLVRQLGAGGMGVVYEADHVRLRQPFAVKVLRPELAEYREFQGRFEREARAAALLRSPHVVRVFDVDVANDGLTYMVMELLDGQDLSQEAELGPIPVPQLADWMIQACAALQEAHDQGIVHRDLKPANIFLAKIENGERIAKVVDFGISKVEATSTNVLSRRDGSVLGTPTYMAPELIRGRRIDGRADLWALGVILYRILGSRWPFNGKTDQEYMSAVLADPPLPFEIVRPDLPYELACVIMKALEKDVSCRYASANEMAAALAPIGTGRGAVIALAGPMPPAPAPTPSPAPNPSPGPVVVSPRTMESAKARATRAERAGLVDTVVDASSAAVAKTAPLAGAHGAHSPPGTVVLAAATPPRPATLRLPWSPASAAASSEHPRRSGRSALPFAAAAAVIGFGAYMIATARGPSTDAKNVASPPASSAGPPSAPIVEAPPVAPDEGRPSPSATVSAATSVTSASASPSSAPRRRPPKATAGSSSTPTATADGSAHPAIPDHL